MFLPMIRLVAIQLLILQSIQCKEITATKEWQLLEKGDSVPKGMHVRMDLETGQKWAKLVDDDDTATPQQQQQQEYENNVDVTGGFSNRFLLTVSISGFVIIVSTLTLICFHSNGRNNAAQRGQQGQQESDRDANEMYERELEDANVATLNRAQRRARAKYRMKKNRRLAPHLQPQRPLIPVEGEEGQNPQVPQLAAAAAVVEEEEEEDERIANGPRKSRKERQKEAKAKERQERLLYVQERKRLIQTRPTATKKKNHLDKQNTLEQQQQQQEEEWKFMFPKKDKFTTDATVETFLTNLYTSKTISLSDTATHYSVTVVELIQRLKQLETEGRIPFGLLDETLGEYCVVTEDDMLLLANFIKQKGSVTINDLREEMTRTIVFKGEATI